MVDTLRTLRDRWPGAELVLLAGADVLTSFHLWRAPLRVRDLATLVVLTRAADPAGGVPLGTAPARTDGGVEGMARVAPAVPPDFPGGPPVLLPTRRVDVSSTEVRARLAAGRSIRGFVPEGVADLIRSAGLYR
jgi:nicotinate-nucleotide adenylyltransferase